MEDGEEMLLKEENGNRTGRRDREERVSNVACSAQPPDQEINDTNPNHHDILS